MNFCGGIHRDGEQRVGYVDTRTESSKYAHHHNQAPRNVERLE